MKTEELPMNKKKNSQIFLNLISSYNTNNVLYYLSKDDIRNLMRCSRYIYSQINNENILLRNLVKNNELQ